MKSLVFSKRFVSWIIQQLKSDWMLDLNQYCLALKINAVIVLVISHNSTYIRPECTAFYWQGSPMFQVLKFSFISISGSRSESSMWNTSFPWRWWPCTYNFVLHFHYSIFHSYMKIASGLYSSNDSDNSRVFFVSVYFFTWHYSTQFVDSSQR